MLVLTQQEGEEIIIGPPGAPVARIRVCGIGRDRVRIGIQADAHVPIVRATLLDTQAEAAAGIVKRARAAATEPRR